MEFTVVTGMSGAGKSKAIDALEDIGFFCVDNIPPQMLGKFVELGKMSGGSIDKVAVVVDARGKDLFRSFIGSLNELGKQETPYRLLFLDARDDVLLNRFKEGRRRHPLLGGNNILTLEDAIRYERRLLRAARERADIVIDTSQMATSRLKECIVQSFLDDERQSMLVYCMSFGFKNGLPGEADLVFDVRCLPNPYYIPDLKEHTGLEAQVYDYVMKWSQSRELLAKLLDLIDFLIPLYIQEGKSRLVVAVGCTGGQHRSVAFARAISQHLEKSSARVVVNHRDMKPFEEPLQKPASPHF